MSAAPEDFLEKLRQSLATIERQLQVPLLAIEGFWTGSKGRGRCYDLVAWVPGATVNHPGLSAVHLSSSTESFAAEALEMGAKLAAERGLTAHLSPLEGPPLPEFPSLRPSPEASFRLQVRLERRGFEPTESEAEVTAVNARQAASALADRVMAAVDDAESLTVRFPALSQQNTLIFRPPPLVDPFPQVTETIRALSLAGAAASSVARYLHLFHPELDPSTHGELYRRALAQPHPVGEGFSSWTFSPRSSAADSQLDWANGRALRALSGALGEAARAGARGLVATALHDRPFLAERRTRSLPLAGGEVVVEAFPADAGGGHLLRVLVDGSSLLLEGEGTEGELLFDPAPPRFVAGDHPTVSLTAEGPALAGRGAALLLSPSTGRARLVPLLDPI